MRKVLNYFSRGEICLWSASVLLIIASFVIFDRENYLTVFAKM